MTTLLSPVIDSPNCGIIHSCFPNHFQNYIFWVYFNKSTRILSTVFIENVQGFKMAFMMNKLAMINSCEINLEK